MKIALAPLAGAVVALAPALALAAPVLTPIPRPDNPLGALPMCVSGDAQIVYADTPAGPMVWAAGVGSTYLATPGIARTHIAAASRDGLIAAGETEIAGTDHVPVVWINRVPAILPTESLIGAVSGLSADGHVAVGYTLKLAESYRAASWTDAGPIRFLDAGTDWTSSQAVDASADGVKVVGFFKAPATGSDRHLVLFTDGVPREITPPMDWSHFPPIPFQVSEALRITDDGTAIVAQLQEPGTGFFRVFRWDGATDEWTDLGLPPGETGVLLNAINADGTALAGFVQRHFEFRGYAWTASSGWYGIRQYLIDNSLPALDEPIIVTGLADDGLSMCLYSSDAGYLLSMQFPPCPGDFNRDGQIDAFDYLDFAAAFDAEDTRSDFNRSGQIDFFDYLDFVVAYDVGCE
jgi:uncharacterized membrane protein